jgi:RNA-binding protein
VTPRPSRTRSPARPKSGPKARPRTDVRGKSKKRVTTNRNAPVKRKVKVKAASEDVLPDMSAAPLLSPRTRRDMRAQAHGLQPLVQVGHDGVTPSVIEAVGRALRDHALIKVRLHEPEDKKRMAEQLAKQSRAALCGLVGHTVILYKPKPVLV